MSNRKLTLAKTITNSSLFDDKNNIDYDFSIGQLDSLPPKNFIKNLKINLSKEKFAYTNPYGDRYLRDLLLNRKGFDQSLADCIIGPGAKQLIFNIISATVSQDDEIIIFKPYWPSFLDIVLYFNGNIKFIQLDDSKTVIEKLDKTISVKTKWIIIINPNNPDGKIFDKTVLKYLDEKINSKKFHKINLLFDHIYHFTIRDHNYKNIENKFLVRNIEKILIVDSASKSYGLPAIRFGWAIGSKKLISFLKLLSTQTYTCVPNFIQRSILDSFESLDNYQDVQSKKISLNREIGVQILNKCKYFQIVNPNAGIYFFPKVLNLNELEIKLYLDYLSNNHNTKIQNGSIFGEKKFLRITISTEIKMVRYICNKLINTLKEFNK